MEFSVAILGRPNVGKSTLFNRLVGKKLALVNDQPGVTRDLREARVKSGDIVFRLIDTAGIENAKDDSLQGRMRRLTERAIELADICLFLVDARAGITVDDLDFAELLRKRAGQIILGANKVEGSSAESGVLEAWKLGLGEPLRLSAEHGIGISELIHLIEKTAQGLHVRNRTHYCFPDKDINEDLEKKNVHLVNQKPVQIAIIGKPNAGKSSVINKIIGENRLLTGPEAGLTRDAISFEIEKEGMSMRIFDTAGMRKKAKITDKLEKLSVGDGIRAIKFAEVVVILMDAAIPLEQQDLRLVDLVEREGRAIVIALNKWDLEKNRKEKLQQLKISLEHSVPKIRGVPLITVSARTGYGLDQLFKAISKIHQVWNRRVPTAKLNQWLLSMVESHPPPAPNGRRIKLRYMTQTKMRPPEFVVMCSNTKKIPESYKRYLINGLRRDFKFPGTPIRLELRNQSSQNPYETRKQKTTRLRKHS